MGKEKVDQGVLMKALDFAYDKAVNGVVGIDSAQEMAEDYIKKGGTKREMANSLIRWQNSKAATSGFVTGLPGLLAMPFTVPVNISSVIFIQVRMIAAIAHIGGHDIKDDKVKSLVYMCLAGNAAKDIMKGVGIDIGKKITQQAIKDISGKTVTQINQKVGFRLVTKFGEKGAVNLGKAVPFIGGFIGGTFDLLATNTIGNVARNTFISDN